VATARRVVEDRPGRDVMFYNVLRHAHQAGGSLEDYFGSHGYERTDDPGRKHHTDWSRLLQVKQTVILR
jgi:6-phosphogluconate dehydrogenase